MEEVNKKEDLLKADELQDFNPFEEPENLHRRNMIHKNKKTKAKLGSGMTAQEEVEEKFPTIFFFSFNLFRFSIEIWYKKCFVINYPKSSIILY